MISPILFDSHFWKQYILTQWIFLIFSKYRFTFWFYFLFFIFFFKRFAGGVPDIVELEHLTVSGNVYFGAGVVLKGTVVIVCNEGSRIDIPPNSVLENVVVTGSLRVVAH